MSSLLIMFLVAIAAVIIVFWILKSLVKAAIIGAIVLLLIGGLYAYFIYSDFGDIRSNFTTKDKVFLLSDDDRLKTGIVVKKLKLNATPQIIDLASLNGMQANFSDKDYEGMLGDRYRMFIVDMDALEAGMPETTYLLVDGKTENVSGMILLRMIEAKDPIAEYGGGATAAMLGIDASSSEEARAQLFGIALSRIMESRGPEFLLQQYLEGNVITYPETAAFKQLNSMPNFLKKRLIEALSDEP